MQQHQSPGLAANRTYLFPYTMPHGGEGYVYVMCPKHHERELGKTLMRGEIPDYARVIACGNGAPDERLRFNMERYYGHIHEHVAAA